MKDINKFEITGRIKRITTDKSGNPTIILAIVRDQKTFRNITIVSDKPIPPEIIEGEKVTVKGYIRASVYYDDANVFRSSFKFVSTEIVAQKTVLEEECGIKGRFYNNDYSKISLIGEITWIQSTGNDWAIIYVTTDINGRKDSVPLSYNTKAKLPKIGKFEKGDRVAVYASAWAQDKVVNGEKRHYDNIMVEDIITVEKADLNIM